MQPRYMSGFGNSFETEALPGALPIGRNSPQKVNYGLYAEQVSGSPFTAPRSTNERTWLYRIRPTVRHAGRFQKVDKAAIRTAPERDDTDLPIGQLRWSSTPTEKGMTFVTGMHTVTTAGDAEAQTGMAAHILLITKSMEREHFFNSDGEMLIVAQQGKLRFRTEFGVIEIEPGEICVIPRGVIFRCELMDGPARAYMCENYGGAFALPDSRSDGVELPRQRTRLLHSGRRVARIAKRPCYRVIVKWGGELYRTKVLAFAARRRGMARQLLSPYKYDLRRFSPVGASVVRPPGSVDLHRL